MPFTFKLEEPKRIPINDHLFLDEPIEDYTCPMCDEMYPSLVIDILTDAWNKPDDLYRETRMILESGYARFIEPLVNRLETIEGASPRIALLRERIRFQLSRSAPLSDRSSLN